MVLMLIICINRGESVPQVYQLLEVAFDHVIVDDLACKQLLLPVGFLHTKHKNELGQYVLGVSPHGTVGTA